MQVADPVRSATFRLLTCADPAAVWSVLTCPSASPRYLHGLSVRTTWEPGAPVELTAAALPALAGEVLCVEPAQRLSLTVEDASGACTYLTWSLRPCDGGSVVRLQVEECDSTEDELEDVWLPVLDRLGALLREG